jgi:phosphopantetheine--protein transferase-like protein
VQCLFSDLLENGKSENNADVFFAEVKNLDINALKEYISDQEAQRASMFHSEKDRSTYICCHSLLRLVISYRLGISPESICLMKEKGNKPFIKEYPLHFNISHTREAFAFVISDKPAGIDIENLYRKIDSETFMNASFNPAERRFIKACDEETRERLFLLWTRKEAFLKALGTGIASDLRDIKVSGKRNLISRKATATLKDKCEINNYFIYSAKVLDNYLSIAVPGKACISLNMIDESYAGILMKAGMHYRNQILSY